MRWKGKVKPGSSSDQLVCLTDVFATAAELTGRALPTDGAEDSVSFLADLTGTGSSIRSNVVSHSVHGEFAYRDGDWKLVFPIGKGGLSKWRGKATGIEAEARRTL